MRPVFQVCWGDVSWGERWFRVSGTHLLKLEAREVPAEGEALERLVDSRVEGANAVGNVHNPRQFLQLVVEMLRYRFAVSCRGGAQRGLIRSIHRRGTRIVCSSGELHTQQQQQRWQSEQQHWGTSELGTSE